MMAGLRERVDNVFAHSMKAQMDAEYALAQAMSLLSSQLTDLFQTADAMVSQGAVNLAGHKFSFRIPEQKPRYNPDTKKFSMRVFEAEFHGGGCSNSFGLGIEVDDNLEVTPIYLGGLKNLQWPLSSPALVELESEFVAWLARERVCDPAVIKPYPISREGQAFHTLR